MSAALIASCLSAVPGQAAEAGTAFDVASTATCLGTMTLNFTAGNLGILPAALSMSVTGQGSCIGLSSGPVSWSTTAAAQAIDADCVDMALLQANGSMTFQSQVPVTMTGVGLTALELWIFDDSSGQNRLIATGAFAWLNPSEIVDCLTPGKGTSTVTLTGAFVVVT